MEYQNDLLMEKTEDIGLKFNSYKKCSGSLLRSQM